VSPRTVPLFVLLSAVAACRSSTPSDEPTIEERAWGQAAASGDHGRDRSDVAPEDNLGGELDAAAPDTAGTDTAAPDAPLSSEDLLELLRPDEPPAEDEARLLRTGLDALGAMAPSPGRDVLMRRVLAAWVKRDAAGTTALVLALPENQREDALAELIPALSQHLEPALLTALLRSSELPEAALRRLLVRCALALARGLPESALACHAALEDRGDRAALHVARALAASEHGEAMTWVDRIRDEALRKEAHAEVLAEVAEGDHDEIEDEALRDWARVRALRRLAVTRPHAAVAGAAAVHDPSRRSEVLEAAAWSWVRQGLPDLAHQATGDVWAAVALTPIRQAAARGTQTPDAAKAPHLAPATKACDEHADPNLAGACRAREAEDALARGSRSETLEALQHIRDDAWRAAALVSLFEGLDAATAREWLRRSGALRDRLPTATKDRHIIALLERCSLPPHARLRDGLALVEDPALRKRLIVDAGAHLSATEGLALLGRLTDPGERVMLCVMVLEGD